MPPFTWGLAAELLLKYGPSAVIFGQKIYQNIQAGRTNEVVTAADVAELVRLTQSGEDIYTKLGITPPPAAPSP